MKLISMTDYVIEQIHERESIGKCWLNVTKYAQFLKQPLKLEMFLPCDEDGNILKEPTHLQKMQAGWMDNPIDDNFYKVKEYNDATKKVLFKVEVDDEFKEEVIWFSRSEDKVSALTYNVFNGTFWKGKNEVKTLENICDLNLELKASEEKNKATAK